jgi:hypothetical protein
MGAAVIAAAIRRREQEVIEDFRVADATAPEKAQSYTAIGLGESLALRRLRNRAVIREATPGLYYLDEEVWSAVRRTRRRVASVVILIIAILLLGILAGTFKR